MIDDFPRGQWKEPKPGLNLASVWGRFRDINLARVEVLERTVSALIEGDVDESLRAQAEREAHKLAGAVGSFGFAEGSQLARQIEMALQDRRMLATEYTLRLSELVLRLRNVLEQDHAKTIDTGIDPEECPLVVLVGSDADLATHLIADGAKQNLNVESVGISNFETLYGARRPRLVIIDVAPEETPEDALDLVRKLSGLEPSLPALVLSERHSFVDRVEAARNGARGFLQKPLATAHLLAFTRDLLDQTRGREPKLLAVDDDPSVLALLRALLQDYGLRVTTLDNPLQFWRVLEDSSPDLLILDIDMPGVNGLELCRVLRNDMHWKQLPVLFLTSHSDPSDIQHVFSAGADDFVAKPIVGPELITRVANRLERTQLQRRFIEVDPSTGLLNRRRFSEGFSALTRFSERYRQPICLAVIGVDNLREINERSGYSTGDSVLRFVADQLSRTFRSEDLVGRWGGDEFLVAMYGMRRCEGVQRVAEMLENLREQVFAGEGGDFKVTFAAGVAQYPEDGAHLQRVYQSADQALDVAKLAGGNRVLPVGWNSETQATHTIDIALVEDDETVAGILVQAFQTRGYSNHWFSDGRGAVGSLAGSTPTLRAKLILLDIDLPGFDGFWVLRQLRAAGVLEHTRVITLTVRASDSEVLAALELGASDHIAKPFSLPILMQRLRRVLET